MGQYHNTRGKNKGSDGPHVPNKAERALLRTLMRKHGLTEEEVRSSKKHRVALAKASASMSTAKQGSHRQETLLRRRLMQKTGLPFYDERLKRIMRRLVDIHNVYSYEVDRVCEQVLGKNYV